MRKLTALTLIVLAAFFVLAFTGTAMAAIADNSPHGGYSSSKGTGPGTDYCLQCHDVHQAAGDYALTRNATITETCATCHALFGNASGTYTWTNMPPDLVDGANATASTFGAYKNTGSWRKSGHGLGVSLNGEPNRHSDVIPDSSSSLKIMVSADYGEGARYNGEPATSFNGTGGLNCASCHTPHGSLVSTDPNQDTDGNGVPNIPFQKKTSDGTSVIDGSYGRQLVVDDSASAHPKNVAPNRLLSAQPNHISTPVTSYNGFCIACHDLNGGSNWAGAGPHNHPPICVSCHKAGELAKGWKDFPHTSGNQRLLGYDSDKICLGCHGSGEEGAGPLP